MHGACCIDMPIAAQTIETLEFPKVRTHLARYTSFSASRSLALELQPATDIHEVATSLRRTGEARQFLDAHPEASIGSTHDIREQVYHAARGGMLEPADFLRIASTLTSMRHLATLLGNTDMTTFPLLTEYRHTLPKLPALEQEIAQTIGEEGTVLDSASTALDRLRNQIQVANARMQDRLNNMVNQFSSYLQDPIVTVRNGRYVVPVKAVHRRHVQGLVHDQSGSGATLYIEPMAVVELNNHLRELQLAEEQEVKRILMRLSYVVGMSAESIRVGVETLALLDLDFAKAKYADVLDCTEPELVSYKTEVDSELPRRQERQDLGGSQKEAQPPLLLQEARHPLLDQKTVVPVDIWLGGAMQLLLITGPNTGGKTVALKTVGLLALMTQAGLHIPAHKPARMPVFAHIFSDIGDEQSIEQSLSTFSSHMRTIIRMLNAIPNPEQTQQHPKQQTLILLDEIGAGTDPVEGAALARAIIERLLEWRCMGIVTTHYAELKVFAHNTPGVENASVEFDTETLAPTYRLTIGLPGRSNALAIATQLGLDAAIVERAHSMMSGESLHIESLLEDIHHKQEASTQAQQRAQELREDAEKYRDRLAAELREIQATRQERIDSALREIEHEMREARAELRRLREEARGNTSSRKQLQETEQRMEEVRDYAQNVVRKARPEDTVQTASISESPFSVGDTVLVRSIGLTGEIVAIDEQEQSADVQVGGFRVNTELSELERQKHAKNKHNRQEPRAITRSITIPDAPDVAMTLDMRGWRLFEAEEKLDPYLNNAYMSGLPMVHLIHGKGTGALRKGVHAILRKHPLVTSFQSGGKDGDTGVTVVKLLER